ncbi:transcription termination factor Rho [Mycobacterium sp. Aquia_213]|uniref:transcription termination factor Rho n=1 Tax=Mycobacterium sp. Aquia_213 TaxID=2991728 RepID=UPI00227081AB|nr:transcription termination factor Rho [Mycobacterium sp. Aquia_213]WAC92965.1 transcription termination factor Rho [Mycobacterium sp. Aquia_213]
MTDTDLFTADENTDSNQLPDAVTTDTPDVKTNVSAGSLSTMVLPELRALANQAGVKGTSGMRKNELIAAIKEIRGQTNGTSAGAAPTEDTGKSEQDKNQEKTAAEEPTAQGEQKDSATEGGPRRERRGASREAGSAARAADEADGEGSESRNGTAPREGDKRETNQRDTNQRDTNQRDTNQRDTNQRDGGPKEAKTDERSSDGGDQQGSGGQQNRGGSNQSNQQDDDGDGRGGRRGRRFRDRRRRGERSGEGGGGGDTELREDDVVQPVAGILDVLDNYAFVRTSGYLAGPHDVYVSMNMVRKNGLRRGDAVTGAVRVPKEGEQPNQRQKFNPLVRLDSVNGGPVEDVKKRPDFQKLTPLYPNQRLRLETTPDRLTTRIIDLIMPIGKGQRALIVSPPKAGKTTILQDIANAITKNNPECHLMVVLVDERPEEVTDMTRSVKGEVIASTFDRPPSDHTSVAELAIERAKRLVEQGKDVVVLLDSITRLGRAYNNASPASGRILSGGVDSTALYPPKRFLGAARNIEEGGSLTIIATAMVETGSTGDTVIFEEFKGTGNAELKLDRKISERRVFPAVDVNPSGTRKDELLLSPDEFGIVHKLRRVLSGLDSHQAIDLLMSQLRKTKTNYEFLVQVSKTTPGNMDND